MWWNIDMYREPRCGMQAVTEIYETGEAQMFTMLSWPLYGVPRWAPNMNRPDGDMDEHCITSRANACAPTQLHDILMHRVQGGRWDKHGPLFPTCGNTKAVLGRAAGKHTHTPEKCSTVNAIALVCNLHGHPVRLIHESCGEKEWPVEGWSCIRNRNQIGMAR